MKKKTNIRLDDDEKDILESFEKNEWMSIKNLGEEKKKSRKIASNSLRKNVRINIRLSGNDLNNIKQKAAFEGLPYQTLISSILHKYASGHLMI